MDVTRDEQSREERLEIARRYRERRRSELRALAATAVNGEVEAVGEFSAAPREAMAAVPLIGIVMVPWARWHAKRAGLPLSMLLALTADELHILDLEKQDMRNDRLAAKPFRSWPRSAARITSVERAFMRTAVKLEVAGEGEPLTLFAPSLRTNPWSAEIVRQLGGDAPEPLDLESQPPP